MKINITEGQHKNIPYLIYDSEAARRLIFINHGIYGSKEQVMHLLGPQLVKLGYQVVAIDAYKHGKRIEEPYASKDKVLSRLRIFGVVKQTTKDILTLFKDKFNHRYQTFDALGVSMGGYTAYYLTTQTTHLDTFVAMISSPAFSKAKVHELPKDYSKELQKEAKEVENLVASMDVSNSVEDMQFKHGIALNGTLDELVPMKHTKDFIERHPDLPMVFKTYDTEHKLTKSMSEDMLSLLKKRF